MKQMNTLVISKDTIKKAYDPKTAFGNPILIKAIEEARKAEEEKNAIKECSICDQYGKKEEECDQCDGRGKYEVTCEHE